MKEILLGQVALYIRLGLIALAGAFADQGLAIYDPVAETLTFRVSDLTALGTGVVLFAGTYVWSRVAKGKGGVT